MGKELHTIPIVVSKNRIAGIQELLNKNLADIVILDDSIQLSLDVSLQITTRGGDPVWSENFIGNGKVISSMAGGDVIREEFDDTLTRVVRQLQNSPTLYKALN